MFGRSSGDAATRSRRWRGYRRRFGTAALAGCGTGRTTGSDRGTVDGSGAGALTGSGAGALAGSGAAARADCGRGAVAGSVRCAGGANDAGRRVGARAAFGSWRGTFTRVRKIASAAAIARTSMIAASDRRPGERPAAIVSCCIADMVTVGGMSSVFLAAAWAPACDAAAVAVARTSSAASRTRPVATPRLEEVAVRCARNTSERNTLSTMRLTVSGRVTCCASYSTVVTGKPWAFGRSTSTTALAR